MPSTAIESAIPPRVLGHLRGEQAGPTVICIGGVHGNEPAGVQALEQVLNELAQKGLARGNFYALSGNRQAMAAQLRYLESDLNRLWTDLRMQALNRRPRHQMRADEQEQYELWQSLQEILSRESGPFYLVDLHTTSSATPPFLTVNDSLLNRAFTRLYPLPVILGIEEYLDGPLLSYLNAQGCVAFGFEGGQHQDPAAVANHRAFVYLTLLWAGCASAEALNAQNHYRHLQRAGAGLKRFYEIYYRCGLRQNDRFTMVSGWKNFAPAKKGALLAHWNGQPQRAPKSTLVFMPLYQKQGNDGYFLIRPVWPFFLGLSKLVRRLGMDRLLPGLPGIRWKNQERNALVVNRRIARFFSRQIFHLLGYRSREVSARRLILYNREARARRKDYRPCPWRKGKRARWYIPGI